MCHSIKRQNNSAATSLQFGVCKFTLVRRSSTELRLQTLIARARASVNKVHMHVNDNDAAQPLMSTHFRVCVLCLCRGFEQTAQHTLFSAFIISTQSAVNTFISITVFDASFFFCMCLLRKGSRQCCNQTQL